MAKIEFKIEFLVVFYHYETYLIFIILFWKVNRECFFIIYKFICHGVERIAVSLIVLMQNLEYLRCNYYLPRALVICDIKVTPQLLRKEKHDVVKDLKIIIN